MPFNEATRIEALSRAGYACCVCRQPMVSLEVHHIQPEALGGPNTLDNAIALCPNDHEDYGGNPDKIKRIKEIRNYWYGIVKDMYKPRELVLIQQLSKDLIQENLPNIKTALREFIDSRIQEITLSNAHATVSSMIGTATSVSASPSVSPSPSEEVRKTEFKD